MSEVQWIPGLIVLLGGIGLGTLLALLSRSPGEAASDAEGPSASQVDYESRLRDLRMRKEQLVETLRGISDLDAAQGHREASAESEQLETQAAQVFRDLEELETQGVPTAEVPRGPAPAEAEQAQRPEPDAGSGSAGLSPELRGMLKGGAFVGFAAVLVWTLQSATVPRQEGMGITGEAPETVRLELPVPTEGEPGGPISGVPTALRAKPSAEVDAARRRVAATPDDADAWAALGYALVEAQGWIDVFETSQTLRKMAPDHPDGLVLEAIVRTAMNMSDEAERLIDKALAEHGDHITALTYKGMLRLQVHDRVAAKAAWNRALQLAGPGQGFEALLSMADGELPPSPERGGSRGLPPGHPPPAAAPAGHPPVAGMPGPAAGTSGQQPAGDSTASTNAAYAGRIELSPGAAPPSSGVLFVIARHPGVTRGPPAMTQRLPGSSFPLPFGLSAANVMMGGPVPDAVDLSVRLDADGNPMTKGPDDWHASAGTVQKGTTDLVLVLEPGTP